MYKESFTGCDTQSHNRRHRFHRHHHPHFAYRRPKYNVPVNVIENDTDFEVHVYAIGFAKEDINISVTNDVLFINGTKTLQEDEKPNFTLQEFPVKNFERSLVLNGKVNINAITAKQENGILIITLPKNEAAKNAGKTIAVM